MFLFIASLVFAGFNFHTNTKVLTTVWLKLLTFFLGLFGVLVAAYILVYSFVFYVLQ
jgi:hypothetical protein